MRYIAIIAILLAVAVVAQQTPREQVPRYDVSKEIAVKGVVQEITDYRCPVTGTVGSHLMIQTGQEMLEVHVAPAKFMREYEVLINKGNEVSMLGNRFTFAGKAAFVPRSITVERTTYFFRDKQGGPVW